MKGGLFIKNHERKLENWIFFGDLKCQFQEKTSSRKSRKPILFQGSMKQVQLESGFH